MVSPRWTRRKAAGAVVQLQHAAHDRWQEGLDEVGCVVLGTAVVVRPVSFLGHAVEVVAVQAPAVLTSSGRSCPAPR